VELDTYYGAEVIMWRVVDWKVCRDLEWFCAFQIWVA